MAATVTILSKSKPLNKAVNYFMLTGDAEYPAGGYPITANQLGLSKIEAIILGAGASLTLVAGWDRANSKILILERTDNTEIDTDEADTVPFFGVAVGI